MAVVFNGTDRLIEITDPSDESMNVQIDLYSAWKEWVQDSPINAGYAPAMRAFGGDPTAGGQNAPRYYFLQNYWRVFVDNGKVVEFALNLYSEDFSTPFIVSAGSGVSNTNSDAVNVNEESIKNQSFTGGRVTINTLGGGIPGTVYPIGTPPVPVDNFPDAYIIATTRNFRDYDLDGSLMLDNTHNIMSSNWYGDSPIKAQIAFDDADTGRATYFRLGLTGMMLPTDRMSVQECALGGPSGLTNFTGIADNCAFNGTIILNNADLGLNFFGDCKSAISGSNKPVVDCNGTTADTQFRGYVGGLEITNFTGGGDMSIDMSGRLRLDSTCTSGVIVVGGVVFLEDLSGPGCTVIKSSTVTELVMSGTGVWTVPEKDEVLAYSKKASDNAEQANNKIN